MRLLLPIAALCVLAGEASAYTFGGFPEEDTEYLKRGPDDLVCLPAPETTCRPVDKKSARGYAKPPRTRRLGNDPIAVIIEDEQRIKVSAGARVLGVFTAGARVTSVNANVFVSPRGGLLAVEYETVGKKADVVAFAIQAGAPIDQPAPLPARGADTGKTAYERVMAQGGVWEQRIVPCDQAGVNLVLRKTRKFDIHITTKCQGQKNTTDLGGTFVTEGSDTVVLEFENENGPLEKLECRLAACQGGGEDCLTCAQEDVVFTMQVVRR